MMIRMQRLQKHLVFHSSLDKLETETIPEFVNYADFADCVLDIFQEVQGKVEAEVEWAAKKFNPITIKEVFDC